MARNLREFVGYPAMKIPPFRLRSYCQYHFDIKGFIGIERLSEIADLCNSPLVHSRNQITQFNRITGIEDITVFNLLKSLTSGKIKRIKTKLE